jgi:hypothetical protein
MDWKAAVDGGCGKREREGWELDAMEERWKWSGEVIVCVCRGGDGAAFVSALYQGFSVLPPLFERLARHLLSNIYIVKYMLVELSLCVLLFAFVSDCFLSIVRSRLFSVSLSPLLGTGCQP